ncbi:MAG: MFS transporter [Clostridia bacterium]|nr:MFS transporter [Clostridia bacterium]MBP3652475.1 MFS transporter [Clostridia bacterium]
MQKTASRRALQILTVSLLLIVCGYSMSFNILSNTMDPLIGEFQLTGAAQGLMTSMMNLGSMIPLLILPLLQGRVHKIWLILGASALQTAMLLLTGASGNFAMLLTACILLGAGNNTTDSCVNSYMVDLHPENRASCLGLLHGFYGIGGLLTPVLVSYVLGKSGWRASYYVAGGIFAVICLLFAIVGSRSSKGSNAVQAAKEAPFTRAMFAEYLRTPRNVLFLIAGALYAAAQLGLLGWIVRYTTVQFNDPQTGSLCLSAYWICVTICRLVTPRLPFKPGRMLIVGALGAGVFHILGLITGSAVGMLIASALIGLISGQWIPVMLSEATIGNEDRTSLITSGVYLIMGLARMLIPLGMGAVSTASLVGAMLLPAAAALLCALFSYLAVRCK